MNVSYSEYNNMYDNYYSIDPNDELYNMALQINDPKNIKKNLYPLYNLQGELNNENIIDDIKRNNNIDSDSISNVNSVDSNSNYDYNPNHKFLDEKYDDYIINKNKNKNISNKQNKNISNKQNKKQRINVYCKPQYGHINYNVPNNYNRLNRNVKCSKYNRNKKNDCINKYYNHDIYDEYIHDLSNKYNYNPLYRKNNNLYINEQNNTYNVSKEFILAILIGIALILLLDIIFNRKY